MHFKLEKHKSYFASWVLTVSTSLRLIYSFLNAKYMRRTLRVGLHRLKTSVKRFFKHFHI